MPTESNVLRDGPVAETTGEVYAVSMMKRFGLGERAFPWDISNLALSRWKGWMLDQESLPG